MSDLTNPSPHVRKLESIASQSKKISSTIRVDVPEGYVLLELVCHGPADVAQVGAGYWFHYGPGYSGKIPALSEKPGRSTSSIGQQQDAEHYAWCYSSIGDSLRWLVEDWGHGTPDFNSIMTETKKSPVEGAELEQLMLAVWLEAFGQEVPETGGLVERVKKTRQKHQDLRAQCFEWLRSGPQGVKKWNELRIDARKAVGKLGKCQFGGCDLRGAYFGNQDLRSSDFRKANLRGARFGGADCRAVDFRGANLSEAWLSGGKFIQADFSDAQFSAGAIRAADCRGAIFSGTDLGGVDFSIADLRGVDLSSANLDRAILFRIKYDERTIFPAGLVIEPELRMEWKGKVKRQSGYTSACSLEELLALIPAPPTPIDAEGDWDEAEERLGIRFPSDFKKLISRYGSGNFLGDLWIYNPLTVDGRKSMVEDLERLEEKREACEYLWPIHPEESGMLPWGHDTNDNYFCWLASGEPDDWPTAKLGHGAEEPESDDVNITTFLFNYARNQYPEMQGGLTFEESDYTFTST